MRHKQKWIFKKSKATLKFVALTVLPIMPTHALISYADVGDIIWQDNFDSLNSEYWNTDEGDGCDIGLCGWGNQELQAYSSDNVSIQSIDDETGNNALVLEAKQETLDNSNFTSGKITSENKITVQYGLIEMRIKVPDLDQGLWPAAWMLGTSTLAWPSKGEIDMMEMGHRLSSRQDWLAYNNDSSDDNDEAPDMNNYTGANMIFYSDDACNDDNPTCAASLSWQIDNAYVSETPMNDRFVIYRTYWTESEMRFTVVDNGVEYDMFESSFILGEDLSAFQAPYYLLFNLAVGGNFTDASTDIDVTAPLPASMQIDYIRIYELDGQGSVTIGDTSTAESGTFGVFTDNSETTNKLEAGVNSEIYLWDPNSSEGNESAYEGDNVINWSVDTAGVWFGGGVQSYQALDMSNFEDGELSFYIKIPADIDFRIGITDTYSNESWLTFPANETTYGLERNGEWGQVTIPIDDIRGTSIALQSIQYPFAISSDSNNLPTSTFSYLIDDILWTGGGEVIETTDDVSDTTDSDNDGINDSIDVCLNSSSTAIVDSTGCEISPSLISATDIFASSEMQAAALAFDGNMQTRWESTHGIESSSLTLDLGSNFHLSQAIIYWEAANAENYTVEGSVDNVNWNTIATFTDGVFGSRTDTLTLSDSYRYVRMNATSRSDGNIWGYSIYEMEVYGVDSSLVIDITDDDNDGVIDSIDACLNSSSTAIVDSTGCEISPSLISGNGGSVFDTFASSEMQAAALAFDGNMQTRWESTHGIESSNLTLDLGTDFHLSEVVIYWEAANAATYNIEASVDNVNWITIATYTDGIFGSRTDTLALSGTYRYVRMNATSRSDGNIWGYSIYEMEVYGVDLSLTDVTDNDDVTDSNSDEASETTDQDSETTTDQDSDTTTDEDNDTTDQDNDTTTDQDSETTTDQDSGQVNTTSIVPLYNSGTVLEQEISFDRGDALVTRFADRGRDRHAKEDQFQAYDHYLSHYWSHRTAQIQFEDYVANGGDSIQVTFITEWQLGATEFRSWYRGVNTVAEYHGNYGGNVIEVDNGSYDDDFNKISDDGDQYRYTLSINEYRSLDGDYAALESGQRMEIEISQFLDGVPEGRENYYGTTYLYIVGEGFVPWKTEGQFEDQSSLREDSYPIDESAWLGGKTTLPYNYTNESDNHFMQMATNLSNINGQAFVLGRRLHHTDFITGAHDETDENGIFEEMVGKAGNHYINSSCAGCHERNGRAIPDDIDEPLDKWVFKVAQANGQADDNIGYILQPSNSNINDATDGEGTVSISAWTEEDGLRTPNYSFSRYTPDLFSARIAPQLVGLGLLEAIDESTILALEDVNDSDNDGISGKAQRIDDPVTGEVRLGRFGWKAATTSLKHQIAAALNTDMGVMTSVLPTPDCGANQTSCGDSGSELDDEDLTNLVKYISLLGVRAQRDIDDSAVQQGQALFAEIGCNACHVPTLTTGANHPFAELRNQTISPYTDLLVHDMGEGLADNLSENDASGAEWRTTPLWGLGLSACVTGGVTNATGAQGGDVCAPEHSYLHDGRARTIEEAILWHGGESQNSNTAYQDLSDTDKAAVLAFLTSL